MDNYCRGLLASMLGEISNKLNVLAEASPDTGIIEYNSWRNLLGTFRYLGSTPGTADSSGLPSDSSVRNFMTAPSNGQGIFSYLGFLESDDASYPNAQLVDFIPNTSSAIKQFGSVISGKDDNNAVLFAMKELREYIERKQPTISLILQNVASRKMGAYDITSNKNVPAMAALSFSEFLRACLPDGHYYSSSLGEAGIPFGIFPGDNADDQLAFAGRALYSLYYPSKIEDLKIP